MQSARGYGLACDRRHRPAKRRQVVLNRGHLWHQASTRDRDVYSVRAMSRLLFLYVHPLSILRTVRCPTECRLTRSQEPWQCTVSLHILKDSQGRALGQSRVDRFGDVIYDKEKVEDRIRRAQHAVLNPNTDYRVFLEDDQPDLTKKEVAFSSNYISLDIRGEDVEDLSFCDLPGMQRIRHLVSSKEPSRLTIYEQG